MIGEVFNSMTREILDNPQNRQAAVVPYNMAKLGIGIALASSVLTLDL